METATAPLHPALDALRVPLASLRTYPRNPRRGSVDALRESLQTNGQYRPVVVNRRTSEVLAGNHTMLAARDLGWEEIAVTYVDVDDDTAARIVAVDNRSSDLATYDERELADLLASLDDLSGTGYVQDDLDAMLASLALDDEPDVEERPRYSFDVFDRDDVIETAALALRESGFPYKRMTRYQAMTEINDLAGMSDAQLLRTRTGYALADSYHPHRYAARVGTQSNALDVFADEAKLRVAIGHLLTYGLPWSSLSSVLSLTHGAQVASNFRPGFAALVLRRFAPKDATVLDTSTGYGGRLVAFLSSTCKRYVGIDPARETHDANTRLAADLCPKSKQVDLICEPAEDVDPVPLKGTCHVAFTSPPYFAKERYSDEPTQSWKRYGDPEAWREGFLIPMLRLQHVALKRNATSVVNIADVVVKSQTVPLVEWTIEAATEIGFALVDVEQLPLTRRWGPQEDVVHTEPVLVLRKR